MNYRGYPSSIVELRGKLERLTALPDGAGEWAAFTREEMRLAEWILPAVRAAIRQGAWREAADPIIQLRSAVHKLAISMRLRNHAQPNLDQERTEADEPLDG